MKKINHEFVPYELAVKLKELGFNEECLARYCVVTEWEKPTGEIKLQLSLDVSIEDKNLIKAPLWQQSREWFREKYGFTFIIDDYNIRGDIGFDYQIRNINKFDIGLRNKVIWNAYDFKTYEEARQACLEKLIELVIDRK